MRILNFLCLILLIAGPVHAQDSGGVITTVNSGQQDADIAIRIRDILSELGNYDDVTVSVSKGIVTFRGTATSTLEATGLADLANRVEGVVAVKNTVTETTDIARRLDPAIARFKSRVEQFVIFLPLAMIAALAGAVIVWLGLRIARARQPWERLAPNLFIAELYRQIVRITFMIGALVIALDILNATALLSTILGAAGIIGLALGFAVRDTVENFIASVMLSIRQPFRPNDTVEINGDEGKVIRLTSRATILLSFDGNHIRIPNATVFKSRIINYSQHIERRFKFTMLIDRDADLRDVRKLVESTVQNLPFVLDHPAAVTWIDTFEPSGVSLVITGWVNQNETSPALAKGEAIRQVQLALSHANIAMTDSSQVILVDRKSTPAPAPSVLHEAAKVESVVPATDNDLNRIVNAEREAESSEDLLRDDALKE
ncbi:small-conductance mechanosensitive channel [Loktanella ponticola]|uniref:Small-conductance mechanosensitive channel n=1 Tax=Yoonia ponticola TaxID=1524255 RepID=A0A7W9BNB0_9RHOB|nr:mechanosensitive ion channel domain-containing protein [Yoonia ponticola]MBB5723194.1 small-conductance mechanosensitive channel [Yoonia ponticola]